MIRLEITDPATGSILVPHLSADLSFDVVRENPLFNRRGDYTYDIDISLRDPHNRAIYQHIDRLTAASRPKNRHARLLCDGHIVAEGTEVILKKEADTLKIQILAGNSEMNYLTADENLRIREMDFGSISGMTPGLAGLNVNKIYPEVNHTFPVLFGDWKDDDGNTSEVWRNKIKQSCTGPTMQYADGNNDLLHPCPFLLFYVEKFIKLLGYTISRNELLEEEKWRRLIILHGYDTLDYAKMLPDWTAAQFLDEIEKFFNCVFLVDYLGKQVQIITATDSVINNSITEIAIEDILDEFSSEYEKDDIKFLHSYKKVGYKKQSNDFWRLAALDKDVKNLCNTVEFSGDIDAINDGDFRIFHDISRDVNFVCIRATVDSDGNRHVWTRDLVVDQFADYGNDDEGLTEFAIIPAETRLRSVSILNASPLFPVGRISQLELKDNDDFPSVLTGGMKADQTTDNLQVAFYAGVIRGKSPVYDSGEEGGLENNGYRPTCFNYRYMIHFLAVSHHQLPFIFDIADNILEGAGEMTLELGSTRGRIANDLSLSKPVDLTTPYTIRFRSSVMLDPTTPFLIHGRLFVCQQLKYTYADGRQNLIVEGIFFPYI